MAKQEEHDYPGWLGFIWDYTIIRFPINHYKLPSLKLTFSPLKMDGWKTILSFWVSAYFQGRAVSFREGSWWLKHPFETYAASNWIISSSSRGEKNKNI